ncbi:hypothetical protein DPMN_133542 [Dreissena polymorpha]|uniref:Uncharacterized protein n=1 Tax=Dreissena polymorpha TaxID=45954 RepID=A0A9D4FYJ4_DREPO|nr:hypothetical protein DPMN_133542 [Dreissena polymorpha]
MWYSKSRRQEDAETKAWQHELRVIHPHGDPEDSWRGFARGTALRETEASKEHEDVRQDPR